MVSVYSLKSFVFHLGSFHNNLIDYNISLCLMDVKKQNSKDFGFSDSFFFLSYFPFPFYKTFLRVSCARLFFIL